jgi:hypothetical protein
MRGDAQGASMSLHIRGWLDIARRKLECVLEGHKWRKYALIRREDYEGPGPVQPLRRECLRCWKDEAR